jgi:hypothetical protein
MSVVPTPSDWLESVSRLSLPPRTNRRLQRLMDLNNEGQLSESQREELESLVEMSETLSLVRSEALRLLGRQPA